MPDKKQSLKDFVVTSNSGKYATEEELMSKFPELQGYDIQILRDFVATSNSGKYATEEELFSKFPEFNIKKKDEFQPTSQEVATESTIKEEKQTTLSDASESKFDYESFIDKDEEDAISDLQSQLTSKGYSVEETGIGDALLVTDNITGEVTEIDLQPIQFFKGTRFEGDTDKRAQEIEKVKKLIQTPADSRRALLSTNQLEAYASDRGSYLKKLESQYPDFKFEYVRDPQKGETLRLTKGDAVGDFEIKRGSGDESKQFAAINNFLYQNMTDEEASAINSKMKIDEFRRIEKDIKNITADIDVSMESAEADFFNENYFKGLFNAMGEAGIDIPDEARTELESGKVTKETYSPITGVTTMQVNMNATDVNNGIQKYFSNNKAAMDAINQYNLSGTIAVRKQKIDRAKKLAIENYYENRPDRDSVKQLVLQVQKDLTDKEADVYTSLEMAKGDLQKMISGINQEMQELSKRNPGVQFEVITNDDGVLQNIISSEPVDELEEVKSRIKYTTTAYRTLAEKSKYELDKINSKSETIDQFMEAANRNYNLFDTSMADLKNALIQLGGGIGIIQTLSAGALEDITGVPVGNLPGTMALPADVRMQMIRGEMSESREKLENFYKTKRTYDEAIAEGSKFEFGVRTFAEQAPNIALAIGTSGVGTSVGLSNAAVSTLVATQFGLTSAGQKYDELTTRQEFGAVAEKALKELESLKGIISDDEYLMQKYELERALEDSKISSTEKTLSVIGTGLVEGVVTRFIGTVPNSIKVLKDLKAPTNFMDDILRSNYTAAKQAVKEFGKRTGGEIIEETSIDLLTQINDYAFLGDQIDLSSLDDVAVTSIITSGAMNTPSTAYSTIMTQTNVNRYKNKIKSLTQEIGTLKDMLMDPDISNIQRTAIHNNISNLISGIAEQTTNMEGDALLMGADNIKEMLTLSGVRNSMLKKAGVENDDSYDIANVKIDNYLKGLDKDAAKKFTDQMKYIDDRRNQIIQSINYDGAIERVFGDKGTELAKNLDPSLTPQQKYVEVYKQVRQEINDNALKEFNDAIQEQETELLPGLPPEDFSNINDEDVRTLSVKNIDEIPEQFRDRARKTDTEVETYSLGLPIGKKKTKVITKGYSYTLTGKEIKDYAIQEQKTRVIPDAQSAEGVQEMEEGVREPSVEEKRKEVEKRRQEELDLVSNAIATSEQTGEMPLVNGELVNKKTLDDINSKYDAELATLDTEQAVAEEVDERAYKLEEVKETTDAAAFAASQAEAIAQRKDDKLQVTPLTQQDAQKILDEGGKLFMTEDGKAGAYVTADGYMGGLFKQPGANRTQAAKVLQEARIKAGGKFFDAFGINTESGKGTTLEDIYIKNGFRPVARMTFNPEFAPKGWEKTNLKNRPDNVFFVYDPTYKATKGEGQRIEDYDQAYDLAKNFSPEAAKIEGEVQKLREMFKAPDQRKQVDNALNALSKIAPDVEVILHESEQAYAEATNEQGRKQKTAGTYQETEVNGRKRKVIHINPEKANVRTVAHETFHAILLNIVKTDAEAKRLTEAMMKAVAKVASPELKAYLDDFASNYDQNIQAEEKLAELIGKLASEYDSLPKPTQNVIKRWLDRLAKMFGLKPFTDTEVIDVLNTIAGKVARGEAITDNDVSAISEGASTFFSEPTIINRKQVSGEIKVSETPADLSFVTSKDIIDIDGLVNEISSKGQKVWFWVADQLGRGIYNDTQVGTEHFLDAGPSFALDPKNRAKKTIWATGKGESEVSKLINKSDYIFIMSGSPIRSKLFNKRVLNILKNRVGDYNAFKKGALNAKPTKPFRDVLEGHDSWESLTESPDRKKLLNAIEDIKEKKDTPLKTFLQDNNAFIELNELRDGFYAQNDFQMNDVMLVLKPTGFGGKSDHSTYENDILGEVVGVPNKKVNAYDLMPDDVKQKYSDAMAESQKAQVVAPYGIGVKGISPRKQIVGKNANLGQEAKDNYYRAIELTKLGKTPKEIRLLTGWEIGKDNKWRYEMFDGDAKIKIPIEKLSIGKTYKLKDILDFPEIYEAYPSIANLAFQLNTRLNANGQYQSENKRLVMNPDKLKGNPVETISTMLHELQHAVQEKEGFTRGTSEEQARAKLKEEYLRQKYENRNPFRRFREILGLPFTSTETLGESLANLERIADKSDFDIYERAAGEVEARNVEKRLSMSESERLNTLLSDTENISRDDQFIIRKQQVTNNEIIQRAKEAGISDAAIRKYLQDDKGLSVKQADDAVRLYNEKLRKEGLKKEGVKDISGKNAKRLYNALMYVKSARANRPKSMVIGREDKAGAIEGAIKRAYNTIGKLDKIMKKMSKPEYEKVMDELDKYLRGNKNANLPDDIKAVAFEMRTHLDNLSRKLIEVGAVPDVEFDNLPPNKKQELIDRAGSEADARAEYKTASENILGNIGEYLNRSYAVHTDKNWKDKVSEKVVEDAKNYLRKSMAKTVEIQAKKENRDLATMLEQEVNAVVDRLLDPNESRAFFSIGSTDAKKTGILTRRLDIAPEIRALTGEEMSPAKNYIISVQKIASLAAQQTFLNNVRETGLGVWLFENEADAPKGFRTRIASETSKTMNPLNGLYTSPEIAKAFNDTYKDPEGRAGDVIKFINAIYLKPLGVVKYSKTILSLGTHSKNIIGNGFFMVANGYITKDFYDAGKVVWNEIKNGDNETLREKYIEYIEAGVINSNVAIKELKNILNNKVTTEQDFEKLVQDRLYGKNALKKIAEKAEMAYQMEDDYFKIVSYEVNKRQYSKALFKNSFENLTGKQQKEVKDIAKEITKNTLPNYERIAKIREFLKYMPIGSNFLSFHMEALRVSYNTIELALKEVKDPRTAAIGVRRLAGISAVVMFSSGLLGSLLGFGGDDEDEEDSVRKLLPYYSENSKINIASTSGNEIIYQDLSASSPYGAIEKAFIAYSRGESLDESMIGSLKEALGPFFADDIIISEFMKAYDVTSSQGFISREGGEAIAKFIYSTSKPGTITSSEKVFIDDRMSILDAAFGREIKLKEQGKLKEAFGQFTGFGYRAVKKDAVLKRKLYEIASVGFGDYKSGKARAASMDYSKRVREFKDGKVSEAEVEDAYKRSNKMYKEAINEAIEIYKSGLTLDVSNEKMKELMKSTGFSKDEIEYISRGETPEMKRKEPELSEYEKLLKKRSKR